MSYNTEEPSSPDPLQDSLTFSSPAKTWSAKRTRHPFPLQESSPRKQTFELDVGNKISPQKIRVTVEAQNLDQDNDNRAFEDRNPISPTPYRAPIIRRKEKTTTTTVPVKGLSDSEDDTPASPTQTPKRGRGRPRKSAGTPVPSKSHSRNTTPGAKPGPRRRRTLGSLVDGDDDEDWDFAIGAGVEVGRGKGRSRSRSVRSASRKNATPATQTGGLSDKQSSSTASRKGKGRRKTLTPSEVLILEDEQDSAMVDQITYGTDDRQGRALAPVSGNSASKCPESISNTASKDDGYDALLSKFTPARKIPEEGGQRVPLPGSQSPTQSTTSTAADFSQHLPQSPLATNDFEHDTYHGESGADNYSRKKRDEEEDRLGDLREFDTILESEGFSMISVESVPSLREHLSSPTSGFVTNANNEPVLLNKIVASLSQIMDTRGEDSFSSVSPEILEAATPGRKQTTCSQVTVRPIHAAGNLHSFSCEPVEVLEGAASVHKSQNSRILLVKRSKQNLKEDSFSSVSPKVLKCATPHHHVQRSNIQLLKTQESKLNEDSFSSIPSEVLQAATPRKPIDKTSFPAMETQTAKPPGNYFSTLSSDTLKNAVSTRSDSASFRPSGRKPRSIEEPAEAKSEVLVQDLANSITSSLRKATSRLLTPEETPSPPQGTGQQTNPAASQGSREAMTEQDLSRAQAPDGSTFMYSQMKSSPPSITSQSFSYGVQIRQHQILQPSVAQTPSIVFSSPSLPPLVQQQPRSRRSRPTLDPQAGDSKEGGLIPSLRAGKVLQDLTIPSSSSSRAHSLGSPFKSPVTRRSSIVVPVGVASLEASNDRAGKIPQITSRTDGSLFGGFSDDTRRELRRSLIMGEELARSQDSSETNKRGNDTSDSREEDPFNNANKQDHSPALVDMHGYTLELPTDSRVSQNQFTTQSRLARSYTSMSWQPEKTISAKIPSDDAKTTSENKDPKTADHHEAPKTNELYNEILQVYKDDREEVWARERAAVSQQIESASTSQVIVLSSDDAKSSPSLPADFDEEDIWQAEARNSSSVLRESFQPEDHGQDLSEKTSRSKIPSIWTKNSKPLTYSNELAYAPVASTNEEKFVFPSQLLSKLEPKRIRHDAPLRIEKKRNTLFTTGPSKVPHEQPQLHGRRSVAPSMPFSDEDDLSSLERSFGQIPQKVNFAPRPRAKLDLSALLASSPLKPKPSAPSFMETSATLRSQSLGSGDVEIHVSTPTSALSAHESSIPSCPFENFNTVSLDGPRDHLSQVPVSESASSDYDSEVESSMASVSISKEDSSATHYPASPGPLYPNRSATPSKSCLRTPSAASPAKSVAFHSPTPSPPPLSGTAWSKAHWLLLESLYLDFFKLGPKCYGDGEAGKRSVLLGKTIVADEESLTLEGWHLDVVAAFREEVSGWDERVIAKRLFALIVGEKNRREGKV